MTLEGKEFAFLPEQATVKVGQPVEIVLKNIGVTTHDFTIEKIALKDKAVASGDEHAMSGMSNTEGTGTLDPDHLPVHVAAEPSHEGTVTFTPTEAGTFEFYCTVAGHKESGMVGRLIVVNP